MMSWWSWLVLVILDLCTVVPMLMVPLLASDSLLFGVYVPEQARTHHEVRAIRKRYTRLFVVLAVAGVAIGAAVYIATGAVVEVLFVVTLCLQLIGAVAAMVVCRRAALRLKASENWILPAESTRRVADLRFREKPIVLHGAWFLLPLLIIALGVGTVIVRWDAIPDTFPSHFGLNGEPDRYSAKTIGSVFLLNGMQLMMIALFLGINRVFKAGRQQLDPHAPELSRNKQQQFRRANSIFLYVLCLIVVALFGYIQAAALFQWTMNGVEFVMICVPLALTAGIVGFIAYLNKKGLTQPVGTAVRDDRYWRGGIFYSNANDPALFVPKRYGVGWTLNMARPMSWVLLIALLVVVVAIIGIAEMASR